MRQDQAPLSCYFPIFLERAFRPVGTGRVLSDPVSRIVIWTKQPQEKQSSYFLGAMWLGQGLS